MENLDINTPETIQLNSHELEVISNPSLIQGPETNEIPNVIYGRLLSGKSINKGGLKNLFESLWQNKAGVKIDDYNEGIIILSFGSEAIKNRILRGQPWHFAGSYLKLIETDAMTQITAELFHQIPFWIQVYGIPPGHLAKPYGERLGKEIANYVGEFLEFDPNYRSSFMRVRVRMVAFRPLLRGKILELGKHKDNIWVSFRYERLSKFCYFCGHLDHIQKECAVLMEELESGSRPILQYSDTLKTVGLAYANSPAVKMTQSANKKSMVQIALEEARTRPKISSTDSNTKRMKVGNASETEDKEVAGLNLTKQKMIEVGEIKNCTNSSKSSAKGTPTVLFNQKASSRGQNDPVGNK